MPDLRRSDELLPTDQADVDGIATPDPGGEPAADVDESG